MFPSDQSIDYGARLDCFFMSSNHPQVAVMTSPSRSDASISQTPPCVLGGGVSERDGVCRYENADAATGPCARRHAEQGVADVAGVFQSRTSSLQRQTVQLLWFP